MVRTPGCDKNTGLRKGTWTPEEDKKLFAYVTRYGSWNWRQLPKFAGLKRCGKSCRLRWLNYLRPNIKRGNYTKEEEEAIIKLHESLGNRWAAIAAYLPGRTDNEIKNHWHTHLYKRVLLVKQNINNNEYSETVQEACRKVRSVSEPKDSQVLNPNIILNSSPVLVQSPIQSSSEVSTTTTETGTEANSVLALAADKRLNNTSSNSTATSFDPFDEFSDTFWTEPFFTDMNTISSYNFSPLSSEFMSHLMDPEMILGSELLDTNYFCYSGLYHEEQDDNLLLFGNFQNANY